MYFPGKRKRHPPEMYQPWAGIFSIEAKENKEADMTWNKDNIKTILDNPEGKTGSVQNHNLIERMLQALDKRVYLKETFLRSCAADCRKFSGNTPGQIRAIARCLKRYTVELESIAREKQQTILDNDYLCQVCGQVRDSATLPSTWVQGTGNVCPGCKANLQAADIALVKHTSCVFTPDKEDDDSILEV